MSIEEIITPASEHWRVRNPAATPDALQALQREAGYSLPRGYIDFMALINGSEGELAIDPWWFQFWPAEDVHDDNRGYEVETYHPDYFGFGSSGGGVMFAFRKGDPTGCVYGIPFCGADPEDIYVVAVTFREFVAALGVPGLED